MTDQPIERQWRHPQYPSAKCPGLSRASAHEGGDHELTVCERRGLIHSLESLKGKRYLRGVLGFVGEKTKGQTEAQLQEALSARNRKGGM